MDSVWPTKPRTWTRQEKTQAYKVWFFKNYFHTKPILNACLRDQK